MLFEFGDECVVYDVVVESCSVFSLYCLWVVFGVVVELVDE